MSEPIPVIVASDAHFLSGLQTTVASTIVHERAHPVSIHLLDGGMHDWQWDSLGATATGLDPRTQMHRHKLDPALLSKYFASRELTVMTYARVVAPMFVPDPYAVYIDSDFLVTRPVSELLPHLDSGKAVAAAPQGDEKLTADCPWASDPNDPALLKYRYVNGGLMLINLEKWRREKLAEELLAFLDKESFKCKYFDQSAINWLLKDSIDYLPPSWNMFAVDLDAKAATIQPGEVNVHYASGMKPWRRPLPTISHKVWWLFNQLFPPTTYPPNPIWQPRNLARYLSQWARQKTKPSLDGGKKSFQRWQDYWTGLRETLPKTR